MPEIIEYNMEFIEIRKVTNNDIKQLQEIGKRTFIETFANDNTPENMLKYLKEKFSFEQIQTELSNKNSEFYFAVSNSGIMGYLKVNLGDAQTELKSSLSLEIERIYVSLEYRGKNVGQLLFNKALKIAKDNSMEFLWLGVWERNLRAINFYKKNGFEGFGEHIFKLGDEDQKDIMMKLYLK